MRKNPNYVEPLFSISILPITMCLPMVSEPLAWSYGEDNMGSTANKVPSFSDLCGGYLSKSGSEFMHHYRLLTSNDYDHFDVRFNNYESYKDLCAILTAIQSVPYKVNMVMLNFLMDNQETLEAAGLLKPSFLDKVDPGRVREQIRDLLLTDEFKDSHLTFSGLARIMDKRIQEARYEQFLIKLAYAYKDSQISFPFFIDFRGRIYR